MARQPRSCRNASLDLLARREHSRFELIRKLKDRDFSLQEIEVTLDALEAENLQSDARYAEAFARQRAQKGNGANRIRYELKERGIDDELIIMALEPWQDQWLEIAARQHEKRFGKQPEDVKERARQTRYLQSRGFGFDIIRQIISD